MAIYTISDLHLPLSVNKPMDIFGNSWSNHHEILKEKWNRKITDDDTVIVPGDLSWATYLKDAYEDFKYINELKGTKIISKGNHDYFYTTLAKMHDFLSVNSFNTIKILQNNYFLVEDILICGTRGWNIYDNSDEGKKLLRREVGRLELSLLSAKKDYPDKEIYVFMHYPPLLSNQKESVFTEILSRFGVKKCYYGHLHSKGIENAFNGQNDNVIFSLVSADFLKFDPLKIK